MEHAANCIESLLRQDYPEDKIQMLVFDGMSDDGTREMVDEYQRRLANMSVLDNPHGKKWIAVNRGIQAARGDVVMIVDAHALYEPDYVSQCVHHLLKTDAANVGGPAVPCAADSYQGRAISLAHQSKFGIGVAKFRQSSYEGYVDTVWPGAFWRSIAADVGPFQEDLTRNQDMEWNTRLRWLGYKIFLTPKIRASYYPRSNLGGLWQQNFGNGLGVSQTIFVNWRAVRLRHLVPLLFLLTILGSIVAALFSLFGLVALAGTVGSYLVLCLLFSAQIAWKNGLKYLPIMPVVFWTIHFSYGTGSLWGLLKFGVIRRWNK